MKYEHIKLQTLPIQPCLYKFAEGCSEYSIMLSYCNQFSMIISCFDVVVNSQLQIDARPHIKDPLCLPASERSIHCCHRVAQLFHPNDPNSFSMSEMATPSASQRPHYFLLMDQVFYSTPYIFQMQTCIVCLQSLSDPSFANFQQLHDTDVHSDDPAAGCPCCSSCLYLVRRLLLGGQEHHQQQPCHDLLLDHLHQRDCPSGTTRQRPHSVFLLSG